MRYAGGDAGQVGLAREGVGRRPVIDKLRTTIPDVTFEGHFTVYRLTREGLHREDLEVAASHVRRRNHVCKVATRAVKDVRGRDRGTGDARGDRVDRTNVRHTRGVVQANLGRPDLTAGKRDVEVQNLDAVHRVAETNLGEDAAVLVVARRSIVAAVEILISAIAETHVVRVVVQNLDVGELCVAIQLAHVVVGAVEHLAHAMRVHVGTGLERIESDFTSRRRGRSAGESVPVLPKIFCCDRRSGRHRDDPRRCQRHQRPRWSPTLHSYLLFHTFLLSGKLLSPNSGSTGRVVGLPPPRRSSIALSAYLLET